MKISIGDVVGTVIVVVVLAGMGKLIHRINEIDDPCYPRNIEQRQVLIEAHERCMVEANCIYEDRDIRWYDNRLETQAQCEAKRNEQ